MLFCAAPLNLCLIMLTSPSLASVHHAGAMGLKGVRVLTFSPFEMKAFGGFWYEAKKKVMWHTTNIASTWNTMIPIMSGTYFLIKWAEWKYEQEQLHHRD